MNLADLVGMHILDAVDFETIKNAGHFDDDAQVIRFRLDGKIYAAVEDPDDGYRSSMKELFMFDGPISNEFSPCTALASMSENTDRDVLEFRDIITGKIVLQVGTDHDDSYYPSFVSVFTPENMAVNQKIQG